MRSPASTSVRITTAPPQELASRYQRAVFQVTD